MATVIFLFIDYTKIISWAVNWKSLNSIGYSVYFYIVLKVYVNGVRCLYGIFCHEMSINNQQNLKPAKRAGWQN